jgi:hypothetical protein
VCSSSNDGPATAPAPAWALGPLLRRWATAAEQDVVGLSSPCLHALLDGATQLGEASGEMAAVVVQRYLQCPSGGGGGGGGVAPAAPYLWGAATPALLDGCYQRLPEKPAHRVLFQRLLAGCPLLRQRFLHAITQRSRAVLAQHGTEKLLQAVQAAAPARASVLALLQWLEERGPAPSTLCELGCLSAALTSCGGGGLELRGVGGGPWLLPHLLALHVPLLAALVAAAAGAERPPAINRQAGGGSAVVEVAEVEDEDEEADWAGDAAWAGDSEVASAYLANPSGCARSRWLGRCALRVLHVVLLRSPPRGAASACLEQLRRVVLGPLVARAGSARGPPLTRDQVQLLEMLVRASPELARRAAGPSLVLAAVTTPLRAIRWRQPASKAEERRALGMLEHCLGGDESALLGDTARERGGKLLLKLLKHRFTCPDAMRSARLLVEAAAVGAAAADASGARRLSTLLLLCLW